MKKNQPLALYTEYVSMTSVLVRFFWARRLWWLVPVIVAMALVGVLTFLASTSPAAPFIYTLF